MYDFGALSFDELLAYVLHFSDMLEFPPGAHVTRSLLMHAIVSAGPFDHEDWYKQCEETQKPLKRETQRVSLICNKLEKLPRVPVPVIYGGGAREHVTDAKVREWQRVALEGRIFRWCLRLKFETDDEWFAERGTDAGRKKDEFLRCFNAWREREAEMPCTPYGCRSGRDWDLCHHCDLMYRELMDGTRERTVCGGHNEQDWQEFVRQRKRKRETLLHEFRDFQWPDSKNVN